MQNPEGKKPEEVYFFWENMFWGRKDILGTCPVCAGASPGAAFARRLGGVSGVSVEVGGNQC